MKKTISNSDDVIDSRDVIERLESLTDERQALVDAIEEADDGEDKEAAQAALDEWQEDDGDEWQALTKLAEEAEGDAPDWTYGATLIRRSYFVDAMRELCQDIGDVPEDLPAYLEIDWQKTADNLEADYTSVDFDGQEYLIR